MGPFQSHALGIGLGKFHKNNFNNFLKVIAKALAACELSGQNTFDHFREVTKEIKSGKGANLEAIDFRLSRYACYLIAQNGDSKKQAIALAQTYFATQTRKQELFENYTDDQKRLLTRDEVTKHNKKLFQTAKDSVVNNFGKFNDAGYLGLYRLTNKQIQKKKKLGKDPLLDRAGATELAANLFRITQTDEQLRTKLDKGDVVGERHASKAHFVVHKSILKRLRNDWVLKKCKEGCEK